MSVKKPKSAPLRVPGEPLPPSGPAPEGPLIGRVKRPMPLRPRGGK